MITGLSLSVKFLFDLFSFIFTGSCSLEDSTPEVSHIHYTKANAEANTPEQRASEDRYHRGFPSPFLYLAYAFATGKNDSQKKNTTAL
ncbi:hypothetical protein BGX38DRAFT_25254 [Terfezia claveryi]|nr:hypothetical protein BGX38DRAFT_25254 [Terfezia claveryi]